MNDHEIVRIAAAMHELRPDWPQASLITLIRKKLGDKPRRDVAVALAWVACESGTATPGRVLEAGPWWRAAAVDSTTRPVQVGPENTCSTCDLPRERCRQVWSEDHDFVSVVDHHRAVAKPTQGFFAELRDRMATTQAERVEQAQAEPTRRPDTPLTISERVSALDAEAAEHARNGRPGRAEYAAARAQMLDRPMNPTDPSTTPGAHQ